MGDEKRNPDYWAGYVMGQIHRDMDAGQVIAILLAAFRAFAEALGKK